MAKANAAARRDVITFSCDNRFVRPGGSGTWSLSLDDLTLRLNGQSIAVGWEWSGENSARLTVPGSGRSIMQYRCD